MALAGIVMASIPTFQLHRVLLQGAADADLTGFAGSLTVDRFAIYFWYIFLIAGALGVLISVRYLAIEEETHGEYYSLLLFSIIGMFFLAAGMDLITLFVGLELMSISIYVLVGFLRRDRRSNEAAIKYLLLGAFSSGLLVYGLSILYGISGSTNLRDIGRELALRPASDPLAFLAIVTAATGLFFKIAAVPFHQWAPDAYEGAPTAITGFMSVGVKAAAFAFTLRLFTVALPAQRSSWEPLVVGVALATMTVGNLAAITQTNSKRLLAYSSIAHVGYMLLGVVAGNATGYYGVTLYLLVYTFMELGAFAVLVVLRARNVIGDEIDDLNGLMKRSPVAAVLMLIFLLSLAGIPPLAGFYGKYFIFLSLIQTQHYKLAVVAVLYVAISLYYYFRMVVPMFMREAPEPAPPKLSYAPGVNAALLISAVLTVVIGLYPQPFIEFARQSVSSIVGQ
jgi:NADH-quinone oxidoreductase subunit N